MTDHGYADDYTVYVCTCSATFTEWADFEDHLANPDD